MLSAFMMDKDSTFIQRFTMNNPDDGEKTSSLADTLYIKYEKNRQDADLTLGSIFYDFFLELAQFAATAEAGNNAMRNEFDQMGSYGRLRFGPTFDDLCHIMGFFWRTFNCHRYWRDEDVRINVLKLINKAIDDGVVVPTISLAGERVFRAGESRLARREYYSALPDSELTEIKTGRKPPFDSFPEGHCQEVDSMQRAIEKFYF